MNQQLEQIVSKAAYEKIIIYEKLLKEWNQKVHLIQSDTIQELHTRHILDSLQVIPIIQEMTECGIINNIEHELENEKARLINPIMRSDRDSKMIDHVSERIQRLQVIDIGSGAGFPGLILAMCGFNQVYLCESNSKKCIFLEEVARQTDTNLKILHQDINYIKDQYDIITSRAFTDLSSLLYHMQRLKRDSTSIGIFPKGRNWYQELIETKKLWQGFNRAYVSITDPDSAILCFRDIIIKK